LSKNQWNLKPESQSLIVISFSISKQRRWMTKEMKRKSLFFQIKTHEQLSKIFFRANNTENNTSKPNRINFFLFFCFHLYSDTMYYCDVNFFRQTNSSEKDFVMSDNEYAMILTFVTWNSIEKQKNCRLDMFIKWKHRKKF
jgi:hypothetical protein